jgi:hypothetical protein
VIKQSILAAHLSLGGLAYIRAIRVGVTVNSREIPINGRK